MKKTLFTLTIAVLLISCKEEKAIDYAIVSGTISNALSKEITITNQFDSDISDKIVLDENGMFTDTIKLSNSNNYNLAEGKNLVPMFLQIGGNVTVNFDAGNLDSTLTISGKGSGASEYFYEKTKIGTIKGQDARTAFFARYSLDETSFIDTLSSIKRKQEELLSKSGDFAEGFKKSEQANIEYEYQSNLFDYTLAHGNITGKPEFKVSDDYKKNMKEFSFENEADYYYSNSYRGLISTNLMSQVQDTVKKDSTLEYGSAYLIMINENIKNQNIKDKLAYDNAKNSVTYANDPTAYYDLYLKTSVNANYNEKINKIYTKVAALAKGSPSPKFVAYENNDGSKTSLDDFKGKYVYADVWATWCGPCLREVPALKKVEKGFHGKNIEFVSISIDAEKDHENWKKMILDKSLVGTQLFSDKSWKSQFITEYMIKGIPRFILIDPDGNIVNANAPRPSSPKLAALFDEIEL